MNKNVLGLSALILLSALPLTTINAMTASCAYDPTKDKFTVVQEYATKAVTGFYLDSFATPVMTVGDATYYVYIKPNFTVRVGKIVKGTRSEYPLNDAYKVNNYGHNEFSIGVDEAGYLHLVGNLHNSRPEYWRSNAPKDPSKFTKIDTSKFPGDNPTYAMFRRDNNGQLYLMARVRALKTYNAQGGRGVGLYKYDSASRQWIARGGLAPRPDATYKVIAWEYSGLKSNPAYQMLKPDLRFDKNNRMHFSVALSVGLSLSNQNYAIYAYSDDQGLTFRRQKGGALITPLPMRVVAGSSQADVIDGYQSAKLDQNAQILLDAGNTPGVSYSIDDAAWYRYFQGTAWSPKISVKSGLCNRCTALSDQDNGVMSISSGGTLFRFTQFGSKISLYKTGAKIYHWDLPALQSKHIYRGVSWDKVTGDWKIIRLDVTNPTKCY